MFTIPDQKENANQNHIKIPPYSFIKNINDNELWGCRRRKRNSYTLPVGMKVSTITMEDNMEAPWNDPAIIAFLGLYPKDCESAFNKSTCTLMFTVTLFTIAKLWKQPSCPSSEEWIKKMWYLCTRDFYSATKKNEILPLECKWMEPEYIILSKISQAQKTKSQVLSHLWNTDLMQM
jgi:hypothetical protein